MKAMLFIAAFAIVPLKTFAYSGACISGPPMATISCVKNMTASGHNITVKVELTKGIVVQNPNAEPGKICNPGPPGTTFFVGITDHDASFGKSMGFFSKYKSNLPAPQGDEPDIDALLAGQTLQTRIYAFGYGKIVGGDEVTLSQVDGVVTASVKVEVREGAGTLRDILLNISQDIVCDVN